MSETLEVSKDDILKEYKKADKKGQGILERLHGKQVFIPNITDRIKSFEDACGVLDMDTTLPDVSAIPKEDQETITNYYKAIIITRGLNEGWQPDWENSSEYKYYPWFKFKSGFGVSGTACDYTGTYTGVGSRLCFKTRELAEYAGKQPEILEYYKKYLT
jgi:hypothetical protein